MEFTKDKKSFNPTPKLKSSPIPISFISFNINEDKCNYCGLEFAMTIRDDQKYCKNCLTWYTKHLTDKNVYLDVHLGTNNIQCNEHEPRNSNFYTQNIQEWCVNCSEILYFKQIIINNFYKIQYKNDQRVIEECKLCGNSVNYSYSIYFN